MRERTKRILVRWRDVVATGVGAVAIWTLVELALTRSLSSATLALADLGIYRLAFVIVAVVGGAMCYFCYGRWLGGLGIKNLAVYPPIWVAVVIGVALLQQDPWVFSAKIYGAPVVLLIGVSLLWLHLRKASGNVATKGQATSHPPSQELVEFNRLVEWIKDDRPISSPERDFFSLDLIAKRIARRLGDHNDRESPTIAITGSLGSGKSSILKLVRFHLHKSHLLDKRIALVDLSLWPFDSPEAAVRGILNKLTSELARHVNTLGIVGLAVAMSKPSKRPEGL